MANQKRKRSLSRVSRLGQAKCRGGKLSPGGARAAWQSVALGLFDTVAARPNARCTASLLSMGFLALTLGVYGANASAL